MVVSKSNLIIYISITKYNFSRILKQGLTENMNSKLFVHFSFSSPSFINRCPIFCGVKIMLFLIISDWGLAKVYKTSFRMKIGPPVKKLWPGNRRSFCESLKVGQYKANYEVSLLKNYNTNNQIHLPLLIFGI